MTFTGPQIAEPLQRRAPDFEKLTGAKINVITVPFSDLYQKLLTDWAGGTNSIDAAVFAPQWMVDYVSPGYLEDLTARIDADKALQEEDVAPFFRDFSQAFAGKKYWSPSMATSKWSTTGPTCCRSSASSRPRPGPTISISPRLPRAWI